jgi:F0F1-type ATP synthase assembly protein I
MPTKKPTSPQKKISKKITTPQDVMTSESSLISGLAYVTVIGWLIAYFSSSQD